ncbi:MAG: cell surface protein SprA [Candidatus Kapabacteria bacterium]|nr:cell surface protein SprA [Candidatus Kapabacteria bacterium]MDW8012168.1 cell surface protein SprA [Bacteroidota bacterium]
MEWWELMRPDNGWLGRHLYFGALGFLAVIVGSTSLQAQEDSYPFLPRQSVWEYRPGVEGIGPGARPLWQERYELDTSLWNWRRRLVYDGIELLPPVRWDFEEYLQWRQRLWRDRLWDSLWQQYDIRLAYSPQERNQLLGQIATITIPLPPSPLLTIFGRPEISISAAGEVNVRAGWRWDWQRLGTASAVGQVQSSPIFSQSINVNVSGRIGDKVRLGVDWGSQRMFEFDNKFRIGYEGYDDDVVRKLEVGNVSFPTPSTLISGAQALFGIRADFQFGPLFLKTVASQKRAERRTTRIQGGALRQRFALRAYDYARNHFLLDTAYRSLYQEYFRYATPVVPASAAPLRVKEIEVWESTTDLRVTQAAEAIAFADLPPVGVGQRYPENLKTAQIVAGEVERGRFVRLDTSQYRFNPHLGVLTILNLRQDRTYAVAYRIEGPTEGANDDLVYGTFANTAGERDTLVLKLITRPNLQPGFRSLWARQLRNIYSIGTRNVQDISVRIWYVRQSNDSTEVIEGVPDKLVTILGVDRINNATGDPTPDGVFDTGPQSPFFNPQTGELIFPSLEPFREGLRAYFAARGVASLAERYVYGAVYDTTIEAARLQTERDRFIIAGEVTGSAGARISLNVFNLEPGSVRVYLDGVPLKEGDDYTVQYYTGEVILRNPRALLPNANVEVEYEPREFAILGARTLLGLRGDLLVAKRRNLTVNWGFTTMFYHQAALIDRVRLGDEPVANWMLGTDVALQWETPWVTDLLNALPLVDTKEKSRLNVRAEVAQMFPTPNTRRSEVASDHNAPVVYIDDFEGADRRFPLGMLPGYWRHSAPPVDPDIAPDPKTAALFRGKLFWYQFFLPETPIREVYPNRDVIPGQSNLRSLYIVFRPDERGIYNPNPEFLDSRNPRFDPANAFAQRPENRRRIWAGMTRLLSSYPLNFDAENFEYLELMMRIEYAEPGARLFIDLGQISEDVIPNGKLDTEDGITSAAPLPNGILDAGEDVGVDGLSDQAERSSLPEPLSLEEDPARDNFVFDYTKDPGLLTEADFERYNNFEGNSRSELGQFPDTEVLNPNNGQTLTLENSYFSYEIRLDPNPATNPQIVGGGSNGWYLYRIPLRRPDRVVGNPLYSNIQYVRLWVKGGALKIRIADWRLVGALWQRRHPFQAAATDADSVLEVAFVNREENSGPPDYYTMPPGVVPPRQLSNPDPTRDIRLNEQSLVLRVRNLRYGDERMAVRLFPQRLDMLYYRKLKFFVHGDGGMPFRIAQGEVPVGEVFVRFGVDSSNYYEYRRPLLQGWQDVQIDLRQLAALKSLRDSLFQVGIVEARLPGDELGRVRIRGNPSLTQVAFMGVGIANPAERFPNLLTTTVWIDELRLTEPDARPDWAGVTAVDLQLADLGTLNFNALRMQPGFHRLEERFGDRILRSSWNGSVTLALEKLFPKEWRELRIPFTYTHSEQLEKPALFPQNDVPVEEAAEIVRQQRLRQGATPQAAAAAAEELRRRSQTLRVQDSWAITGLRLGIPSSLWWIRDIFNRFTVGYSYAQEFERSPQVAERFRWRWNLTVQYALQMQPLLTLQPLGWGTKIPLVSEFAGWRLSPWPTNIGFGLTMTRGRQTEQLRDVPFPSPVVREFTAQQQFQSSWRLSEGGLLNPTVDYSLTTNSTLVPLEVDPVTGRQRTGREIFRQMLFRNGRPLYLGEETSLRQNVTVNFRPRLAELLRLQRFLDMSGSYTVTYSWTDPRQPDPAIRDIVKQAQWQSSFRWNTALRVKQMAESWFGKVPTGDTPTVVQRALRILRSALLDYDNVQINFQQDNSSLNPGVLGGTGLTNFWLRTLLFRPERPLYGPSMGYQLGLLASPHGSIRIVRSERFPFFGFATTLGPRPPQAVLQENFAQRSVLDIRTSRPLWEGATLTLSWKSEFAYNRNWTLQTDANGVPTPTAVVVTNSYSRTALFLPPFLVLALFRNSHERVLQLYEQRRQAIVAAVADTVERNTRLQQALAESFREGLESFRWYPGALALIMPRVNWILRWDGLEKWGIFRSIGAQRVSLDHSYAATYRENTRLTDRGRTIDAQSIEANFQPFLGVNVNFNEKAFGGPATAILRYNLRYGYQLGAAARSLQRQVSHEFSLQVNHTRRGLVLPLIGTELKNDVEFSLLASIRRNLTSSHDVFRSGGDQGLRVDGSTQISVEPRARYTISQRLTATLFMRYDGVFNEGAAQPGYSTFQMGVDIRLGISGGR